MTLNLVKNLISHNQKVVIDLIVQVHKIFLKYFKNQFINLKL